VVGDVGALLVTVTDPDDVVAEGGAKLVVKDVLCPAGTEIGSVNPETEYPEPDAVICEIVRVAFPGLFNVTV